MARTTDRKREGMGARVAALREKRGWTQEELAKKARISRSSLKSKELGDRTFSLEDACTLSDIFGITLDELVNGVTTKGWNVYKDIGLNDSAIQAFRVFKAQSSPEMQECLNRALSFRAALNALAQFMAVPAEEEETRMCESSYLPDERAYLCKMTPRVYDSVMTYNLIDLLKMIRTDQYMEINTPPLSKEQLDTLTEYLGGIKKDAEKK